MVKEYSKEEFWKLYEKLPIELQDAIFSKETAETIDNVCSANGIEDKRVQEIAECVGKVLLGIFPLEEFRKALEKDMKLNPQKAEKVFRELNRFIFHSLTSSLEKLYKIPKSKEKAEKKLIYIGNL